MIAPTDPQGTLESIFVTCLPPDRTWHKVNDPKVGYSWGLGEGKIGHEPRLESCWTMMQLAPPLPKVAQPKPEALWPQVYFCWTGAINFT